jgi:hypothetical protein
MVVRWWFVAEEEEEEGERGLEDDDGLQAMPSWGLHRGVGAWATFVETGAGMPRDDVAWGLHRRVGAGATFAGTGVGMPRGRRSHESGLHYALNSCRDRLDLPLRFGDYDVFNAFIKTPHNSMH